MSIINKIKELKELGMNTDYKGQLYISLPAVLFQTGSPIYKDVVCATITCDHIGSSGLVVLVMHYPSNYTGRWEKRSEFCNTAKDIINVLRMLGRPMTDLDAIKAS